MKTPATLLKIVSLCALAGTVSCQSEFDQDFDLALRQDKVVLINAATRSCALQIADPGFAQGNDIPADYAYFGGFQINWKSSNKHPLHLEYVEITFRGAAVGGKKVITLAGTDLAFIWSGSATITDILPGTEPTSSSKCNMVVGGITVADPAQSYDGQGTFLVYGTTLADDGNGVVPVISTTNFSYTYRGTGQ